MSELLKALKLNKLLLERFRSAVVFFICFYKLIFYFARMHLNWLESDSKYIINYKKSKSDSKDS